MTERSPVKKIKRLENQYFKFAEGSRQRKNIEQRITTIKKTHNIS